MPTIAVETKVIEDAVRTACRAPSLHNSQPWQWLFNGGQLRLFLDPSRVMDTDHSAREALISCGAALDHLRVAMAAAGWQSHIDRFPNPNSPSHLASIEFMPTEFVTERDRRLAGAIGVRRTDRLPFSAVTEWQSIEAVVASSANRQAVHLEVIADDLHPRLKEAAQIAESFRSYDTRYQNELCWWTAPFESWQGIPYSALVSAAEGNRVGIGRVFPAPHRPERRLEIPEDHAKVLLLSTDDDTRADALAAGEALSATLLECTMAGLATCPITHLTEVDAARDLIRSLMDYDAVPQVLIRAGAVPVTEKVPPPTPRRLLSEVLRLRGYGE
ncbi:NAD(P)H nitroreductase [Mycobacterium rhizamassiliense]|jgi:nitroreductase|uniref:NAD(P)H nitroreductase n=1 Tax=Mycobacterium rhizamassiliense TaxID=1841860 RepID=A0A2U3NL51_9MYCO|nr:nitroreductase family protein [Mycobacterium rhizamassiliense]SPM32267.1 NAD(P)H nitroreductase [Mycobacterium rhizamassiliense]